MRKHLVAVESSTYAKKIESMSLGLKAGFELIEPSKRPHISTNYHLFIYWRIAELFGTNLLVSPKFQKNNEIKIINP